MVLEEQKFLVIGSQRAGAIETAYANALRRLRIKVVDHFDHEDSTSFLAYNRLINRSTPWLQNQLVGHSLIRYLESHAQAYRVIIVFKGMSLTSAWVARCKTVTPRTIWVNVNPDDPFNVVSRGCSNRNVLQSIRLFDLYATWGRHLLQPIQAAGCDVTLHLPFAYDRDQHFAPRSADSELKNCITFVGAWDRQREEILTAVSDLPLRIYGYGWHRVHGKSRLRAKVVPHNIYGEELRRTIGSARASINILRPQNHGAHNMRSFEIPAMGGLMVTTRSQEQEELFPEGTSSLMFGDKDELREKLKSILSNEYDDPLIRATAIGRLCGQSYDDRAKSLVETVAKRYRS